MSKEGGVRQFLESLGLQEFFPRFTEHGFDLVQDVFRLEDEDLAMLIPDEKHQANFRAALHKDPKLVKAWLYSLGLERYYEPFQASGFTNLAKCTLLSPQSLDTMQITIPGHKKRLLREAQSLLGRGKVIAEGAWEEHEQLTGGRFGKFLCLTADVFPPLDPRFRGDDPKDDNMARVKFMIDSGSDVGSLVDDVIKTLKLPVVGRCVQEGAGGATQERPLYSACLVIGEKKLNIQVVPDKVSTLGTPVLYEFSHRIDAEKHLWLAKDGDQTMKVYSAAV